ncbi:hypothetical protein M3Y97_00802800 [Aphelenchoides bicaudatus]|nr:hypothetical protein M3Y97_00802800 [Aphelenchoides bicaudatus]
MNKPISNSTSESMSTLRICDASNTNLYNNVASTQNIIDADELSGLTNLRYTRLGRFGKIITVAKAFKSPGILVLSPLLLSVLIVQGKPEYNCLFCVLLMSIYWMTEVIPLPITALLPIILFPLLGVLPAKLVAREYLNDTTFLFIGGLIVAVAVETCNLHNRLALSVLRLVGSQPKWIMMGFMLATAFLSMFISNTATTAMMVPICTSVTEQLIKSYKEDAKPENSNQLLETTPTSQRTKLTKREQQVAKGLMISICFAANIGGTATLTGTPPNLVLIGVLSALYGNADTGIHYLSWMMFGLPLMLFCLVTCWAILVFVFLKDAPRASDGINKMMNERYRSLPSMHFAEKSVLASFFLLLFMWIGRDPQVVPGFGAYLPAGYFTDATSAMIIALLMFILPAEIPSMRQILNPTLEDKKSKKSTRLMNWEVMQSKFPWAVVLLLGGGFALASGVKETGLSNIIGESLSGLNGFPTFVLQIICLFATMVVTNVCSNTVSASIFLPIVANLAQETGVNPLCLMLIVTIGCSFAFVLPVGTPSNTICFASGVLRVSDMIVAGLLVSLGTLLITVIYLNTGALLIFTLNEVPKWARAAISFNHIVVLRESRPTSKQSEIFISYH